MEQIEIKHFIEAAMLAAGRPLTVDQLKALFDGRSAPENKEIRDAINALNEDYEQRGVEVAEVASGFRIQIRSTMTGRLQKLWEERPPRYSRALFETLALIAYRQPITRGEIEEVRGVAVSSNIVRSLMERDWVRVVGHRDVPGRPAMFGTTKAFLDYFGLKKLDDLPELSDLADWESLRVQLDLPEVEDSGEVATEVPAVAAELTPEDDDADTSVAAEAEGGETAAPSDAASATTEPANDAAVEAADDASPEPELQDEDMPAEPEVSAAEDENDDGPSLVDISVERVGDAPESVVTEEQAAEDELVVSEWPDPAKSGDAPAHEEDELGDGKDASAGG